jgi:integration host factor subunit beta
MTKSELVSALAERQPQLLKQNVELAVNCILTQMADAIAKGERIEIRGFGSFDLHHRAPRVARNPRTGETVNSPAKTAVHFKPGKDMKDRGNAARDQCGMTERGIN